MAMNKQRRTSNISNIFSYDDAGNIVLKDYGQVTRYSWNGLIHGFIGSVSVSSVAAATTDTDKFLVSDNGVLKYRTGSELLSDIGAQSFNGTGFVKMSGTSITYDNSTYLTTADATSYYVPYSGATTDVNLNTKNLLLGQGSVGSYILMVGNAGTNYLQIENAGNRTRYQMDSLIFTNKQVGGTKTVYFNTNASTGTDYTISFPDKNGTVAMTSDIVAGITGTGTANYIPKWTGTSVLGNSVIYETSNNIILGSTTNAGQKLQVTSSTGDSHLLVWGASAPSIRIDNAGSSATQRFVLGLATATNNFITGAVAGDICMTTQSSNPLLFGANALEVMRITTSRNLLIGTATDYGEKLVVDGTTRLRSYTGIGINADLSTMLYVQGSGTTSADFSAVFQNSNFDNLMKIHNNGKINMGYLPTSSAGLVAGDIWNNGGVLNIV